MTLHFLLTFFFGEHLTGGWPEFSGATPVNIQPIAVHVLASDGSHFGMMCSSMYYAYYLSI